MEQDAEQPKPSRGAWVKQHVLGLGVGAAAVIYGIVAVFVGRTFLPGLPGSEHTVRNFSGFALAVAYLLGGLYLLVRFFLEPRLRSPGARAPLHMLEILLLLGFNGFLVYFMFRFGALQ